MDLILCHTTADFDALGAAVGLTRLHQGAKVVLAGGTHPAVGDFLALYRDEYALIERRSVNPKQIRSLIIVDTQQRDRLGKVAEWLDLPHLKSIQVYDHHPHAQSDIPATKVQIEPVGATTTLIAEKLQQQQVRLTPAEATVMALGIHVDTGSLTFEGATARDASALAWLMARGANVRAIADYLDPGFSPQLQRLLPVALSTLESETLRGYKVAWVLLKTDGYIPGLSSLASRLMEITESDALLLAAADPWGESGEERLTVIGRSQIDRLDLNDLFQPLGGGGHAQAASLIWRGRDASATLGTLVDRLRDAIPHPLTARELMSSPVRTVRPETTIGEAQRILLRYGHSGLSVVNDRDLLVGIISRRDIDLALHHGFSHAPVKGYMTDNPKTITSDTLLPEIESLMVTYDIGRLPVLEAGQLVGIVTRTDVLRQLLQGREGERAREREGEKEGSYPAVPSPPDLLSLLRDRIAPQLWELLAQASHQAERKGWQLYLVGGAVRDLLLEVRSSGESQESGVRSQEEAREELLTQHSTLNTPHSTLNTPHSTLNTQHSTLHTSLTDLDLVVDGFHRVADVGAGVELASALQNLHPEARLEVHGAFQTAALLWHKHPVFDSLWVDIATARTEFYPYPAANPEVEASSIRQDLYRRDFTINALAIGLTNPRAGEILDFFGGWLDLQNRQIRVLHANSLIEDPTRIYRAVRFAVRLGFEIEPQTEGYIRYAIDSGIYERSLLADRKTPALQTRLKAELKYILQASYWEKALKLLASLGALKCLHSHLELDDRLWWQVRLADRWLRRFDPKLTLSHWQIRLEVLIACLAPGERGLVASNLQLPADSIERLQKLAAAKAQIDRSLPTCQRPSQVVRVLSQYELPALILIAVQSGRSTRQKIWQYLTHWVNVRSLLNGNDLKTLGYRPGPLYKQIIDDLLAATLDGVIRDRPTAETFLLKHYPKS
ncbi:MAG: CBS domain-containing protein [Cyanosarcina radialis HA8281-LM2]|jgi:tRNA nucleotidyltransferase (CCA-adding enzyme)|nr:CBS domain-containing protein [Cyanosarcina radialis HA8281-LM2]